LNTLTDCCVFLGSGCIGQQRFSPVREPSHNAAACSNSQGNAKLGMPRTRSVHLKSHAVFKTSEVLLTLGGNLVFFPMWGDVRIRTHCGARRFGPVGRQKTLSTCQAQSWRGAGAAVLWPTTVVVVVLATPVTRHRTRNRNIAGIRIAPPLGNGQDLLCSVLLRYKAVCRRYAA
jgi:hypothetical protein